MNLKKILLVEDTPDDAELTLLSLHDAGVSNEVIVVEDGEQALDYMLGRGRFLGRDCTDTPAIVLMDLKLPKLNGVEVLKRIRKDERIQLTPVVMLTTSREEIDLVAAYESGVNAYVRKPINFNEFSQVVKKLGMFWLLVNEQPPCKK